MRTLFLAVAALGLIGCSSLPDLPDMPNLPDLPDMPRIQGLDERLGERVDWSCASGSSFSIRINEETQRAEAFASGRRYRLEKTADGYGDGAVSYIQRGDFASLSGARGGPYDLCRRV
jgi:hypothetical protein